MIKDFDLRTLNGTNGFYGYGEPYNLLGVSVAIIGDINGDSFNDFAVGASSVPSKDGYGAGKVYVFFGSDQPFQVPINLKNLDGTNGFTITAPHTNSYLGYTLSKGLDFNCDGKLDFAVSAPGINNNAGSTYVIFGRNSNYPSNIDVSQLDRSQGIEIQGNSTDSGASATAALADINGDKCDDLIIGAKDYNNGQGIAYIVYGSHNFESPFNLKQLDGTNGFTFQSDRRFKADIGHAVAGLGDVNGDKIPDIGITTSDDSGNGAVFVMFGGQNFDKTLYPYSLTGHNGFIVHGDNAVGASLSSGDLNYDGLNEIISGNSMNDVNGTIWGKGDVYVAHVNSQALKMADSSAGLHIYPTDFYQEAGFTVAVGNFTGSGNHVIFGARASGGHGDVSIILDSLGQRYGSYNLNANTSHILRFSPTAASNDMAYGGSLDVGDINGDGLDDIISGGENGDNNYNGYFSVVFGNSAFSIDEQ